MFGLVQLKAQVTARLAHIRWPAPPTVPEDSNWFLWFVRPQEEESAVIPTNISGFTYTNPAERTTK